MQASVACVVAHVSLGLATDITAVFAAVASCSGEGRHNQGFFSQPVSGNRRPPVPVYRTGWSGNRLIPDLNSNFSGEAKPTGIPAGYTGLPAGFAGIPVVSSSFPTLKKWIPGVK